MNRSVPLPCQCCGCFVARPRRDYARSQLKRGRYKRRCKYCVAHAGLNSHSACAVALVLECLRVYEPALYDDIATTALCSVNAYTELDDALAGFLFRVSRGTRILRHLADVPLLVRQPGSFGEARYSYYYSIMESDAMHKATIYYDRTLSWRAKRANLILLVKRAGYFDASVC